MMIRLADGQAPAGWPRIARRPEPLAAPALTWSSERCGWEGFTVRTYDEPPEAPVALSMGAALDRLPGV